MASYAEKMNNTKLMLAGLEANQERLAKRGLDASFTGNFTTVYNDSLTLDNEQEKLKAEQKAKSQALKAKIKENDKLYAEAKKIVKIEMEPTAWKEFGIEDKR